MGNSIVDPLLIILFIDSGLPLRIKQRSHRLDELKSLLGADLVKAQVTFSNVRGNPLELNETKTEVLTLVVFTPMDVLKVTLADAAKPVLVSSLAFSKNVDEGIFVDCQIGELLQRFKQLALDLSVLNPNLFKVDVVTPLVVTLSSFKRAKLGVRPI